MLFERVAPLAIVGRSYLGRVGIALDRFLNALVGGRDDQTISQTVGLALLGRRPWAKPASWALTLINNERHHAARALYLDAGGAPIWPSRMPACAPLANPYPQLVRVL